MDLGASMVGGLIMDVKKAVILYDSGFYNKLSDYEKVKFQLFEPLLCMPFDAFHHAVENVLGRPVFTHEFGLNLEGLKEEFLGESPSPTPEEIMNLILENNRVIVGI